MYLAQCGNPHLGLVRQFASVLGINDKVLAVGGLQEQCL